MATHKKPVANVEFLKRVFSIPEHEKATLIQLEKQISENLNEFLAQSKVVGEIPLSKLAENFSSSVVPEAPTLVKDHVAFLQQQVIPFCVNTGSPKFIGHMTSALPYFMNSLSKCMVALHQNVVKIETSRSMTLLERQTIGMLHRLFYSNDNGFYQENLHSRSSTLGLQTSGGTIANISALWIARNLYIEKVLGPAECREAGLIEALLKAGRRNACVFISQRGHFSFKKAADILGIGKKNLISIPVDQSHKIDLRELEKAIARARKDNIEPLAVVGVAGTTETGHVDPLDALADLCAAQGIHFHVDAAWGGPVVFSHKYRGLLKGIERADSITVDGHKQLYLPMGIGYLLLKDPAAAHCIEQNASYIIRNNSFDLGRRSLEGSRPAMALLAFSALHIFGSSGYALLLERNNDMARLFAGLIEKHPRFELITAPELNVLTYRFNPLKGKSASAYNSELSELNTQLQKRQRENGRSFVSRTTFRHPEPKGEMLTVLRSIIANPHTNETDLADILREQDELGHALLAERAAQFPKLISHRD